MNHLISSRRHEYGILRAMGITNKNFRKLMLGQGALYGIFSSIVMILLYIIGNKTMEYLMGHVYGFLVSNIQVNVWLIIATVAVNICIGIFCSSYSNTFYTKRRYRTASEFDINKRLMYIPVSVLILSGIYN